MTAPDLIAELSPCGDCGMPCEQNEYHPYAACLMFKTCHNSDTVRGNLQDVQDYAVRTHHAEIEAMARDAVPVSELAKLLPGVYYMTPPDGGDVPVIEQLRRMAVDASRYRALRNSELIEDSDGAPVGLEVTQWAVDGCGSSCYGYELDEAIDAAMHDSAREGGSNE